MKNKPDIEIHILPILKANRPFDYRYKVTINWVRAGQAWINDNCGSGFCMADAEHFAYGMRDCIKPANLK